MINNDEIILNEAGLWGGSFRGPRSGNQDCLGYRIYRTAPLRMALVLCDGGSQQGEKASRFLVDETLKLLEHYPDTPPTESMFETLTEQLANALDASAAAKHFNESASTWCLVYIAQGTVMAGHMGDSRIYLFEQGQPLYISRDHSLVNDMLQAGLISEDEVAGHPQRKMITKAFHACEPENRTKGTVCLFPFNPDLQILLCSDGFFPLYPSQVSENPVNWNREKVLSLCRLSTDTRDNVSILYAQPAEIPGASGWQDTPGPETSETNASGNTARAGRSPFGMRLLMLMLGLFLALLAGYQAYTLYCSGAKEADAFRNKGMLAVTSDVPCELLLDGQKYTLQKASDTLQVELDTGFYQCMAISADQFKISDTLNVRIYSGERMEHRFQLADKIQQFQSALRIKSPLKSLTGNMVDIAGGTFTMGNTSEQRIDGESDEKPAHQVTLNGFRMGKYEVAQSEWEAVMGSNPSHFHDCPTCPVENVSWEDVQIFLQKLNRRTGGNYRLPTEAEWEFAARGGNGGSGAYYSGGYDIAALAWYDGNSGEKTHPVGQKQANSLGLYDMSGNVWEWCSDWYGENYYSNTPDANPSGPSSGTSRVLRGGSWYDDLGGCRVSCRLYFVPDLRYRVFGFRLVSPIQ